MKYVDLIQPVLKDVPPAVRFGLQVLFFGIICISLLLHTELNQPIASNSQESIESQNDVQEERGLVTRIIDGDTIKVAINNTEETVRIANINTPETVHPNKIVECYGKEATQKITDLILDKTIVLKADQTQQDRDRYGRLIRYVFLNSDQTSADIGLTLVSEGYAHASHYGNTPHEYFELYESAQKKAQIEQKGLWNPDNCSEIQKDITR